MIYMQILCLCEHQHDDYDKADDDDDFNDYDDNFNDEDDHDNDDYDYDDHDDDGDDDDEDVCRVSKEQLVEESGVWHLLPLSDIRLR